MNIYVGNLAKSTTEDVLTEVFSQCGTVNSAKIITDRFSGLSRGFGFVEMSSKGEGQKVISELDGKEIDGRQIKVNEARPRVNRGGDFGSRKNRW